MSTRPGSLTEVLSVAIGCGCWLYVKYWIGLGLVIPTGRKVLLQSDTVLVHCFLIIKFTI